MLCRQCGTEIADKALICYRCGTATTEPLYKPPAGSGRGRSRSTMLALVIILIVVLLALLYVFAPGALGLADGETNETGAAASITDHGLFHAHDFRHL